ncbi:cellular retinoic acid-binding protein 2b isoform X2 [Syngnathus acus]|uniref:cellular retinoic acid-binding protein 2b isoform X2 n=1 Tax=Syngnathus acus TaxID=161584 RepID=UPI0018860C5C|nr:cellular retinoic acid-binding protein 2b isoform X2 [Syngnathus acus]
MQGEAAKSRLLFLLAGASSRPGELLANRKETQMQERGVDISDLAHSVTRAEFVQKERNKPSTQIGKMEKKIPDFSGKWKMKSSEYFEELLKALGVNMFVRKIAVAAASSPAVEISQQGESLSIKTSTSIRTTHVSFTVGQSFHETTVDGRPCTSFPTWESESKISCEQTLQKGEGPKTAWTRELTNDGELILTMTAGDVVCTRVYERE